MSRSSRGAIAAPSLPPSCQPVVDLIPLARGNDRRLAAVAIHALSLLGVEEAIPAVAPLARTVPTRIRLEAIEFLSHWPESDDAEEAVLEASHSDAARVRTAAAIALALSDDDRATERLTEIADGDLATSVTQPAWYARFLKSTPRSSAALGGALRELTMAAASEDTEAVRVSPPEGWGSVRCWRAPGHAGAPEQLPRLGSGTHDLAMIGSSGGKNCGLTSIRRRGPEDAGFRHRSSPRNPLSR